MTFSPAKARRFYYFFFFFLPYSCLRSSFLYCLFNIVLRRRESNQCMDRGGHLNLLAIYTINGVLVDQIDFGWDAD